MYGDMGLSIHKPAIGLSDDRDVQLVVFSDDWGRHPSSSQHLVRELLLRNRMCCGGDCVGCRSYRVHWVNTIGMRRPSLSLGDLTRVMGKLGEWLGPGSGNEDSGAGQSAAGATASDGLRVSSPKMWPGFRQPWQRRMNANLLASHVNEQLGRRTDAYRVAMTTLPITADLVGRVDVDRWVYYCVDDFSVWPGLDSRVMQTMERELIGRVDAVVAASAELRARIGSVGRDSMLLTHGIDPKHWVSGSRAKPQALSGVDGPIVMFWGLIDRRLDVAWCRTLDEALGKRGGKLVLVGPVQDADPAITRLEHTLFPGAVPYGELPGWAAASDVLVMPYADLPVTRAMQPLKLKEYLATGKPVVLRDLPATRDWSGAADAVCDAEALVSRVLERIESGLPLAQQQARQRLSRETWEHKLDQLIPILLGQDHASERIAA